MRTGDTALYEPPSGKLGCRRQLLHNQYSQAVRHRNPCCRSLVLVTDIIQEERALATCGKRRATGESCTGRAGKGGQSASTTLALRQFRWAKGIQFTRLGLCFPLTLRLVPEISQAEKNKMF